jgi:hypothetical protein
LLLLVAGALLPLIVFTIGFTVFYWRQQGEALELRYLERVRAMSVAVDTELEGSIRLLQALSLAPDLDMKHPELFAGRMRRFLDSQPMWTQFALGDPEWRNVVTVGRGGATPPAPVIEPRAFMAIARTRSPSVSPLLHTAENRYETQIAVPVVRDSATTGILMVSVDQKAWLQLMGRYRMSSRATMTLVDQDGTIIARTLNNETWVGKPTTSNFRRLLVETTEGTARSKGLEGQSFYSAYSRASRWGWTVATGVPTEEAEEGMRKAAVGIAAGAVVSLGLVLLLAFVFARRIATSMSIGPAART